MYSNMSSKLGGFQKISLIFESIAIVCAFLAVVLSCFDIFPMNVGYLQPRPTYFFMLVGMTAWAVSGRWYCNIAKYWQLFSLIFALLIWGGISTYFGSLERDSHSLTKYFMLSYFKWRVIPFLGLCWIATLFASMPRTKAKQIFSIALLCLFIPNAVHMVCEMLANFGATSVKDFLISINPYFRMEAVGHGWWPPPYFTGRIRGLYAEPTHMISGLFPVLGLLCYMASKNIKMVIFVLLLLLCFFASKTITGYFSLTACFWLIFAYFFFFRSSRRKSLLIFVVCLSLLAALSASMVMKKNSVFQDAERACGNINAISFFLSESAKGQQPSILPVDSKPVGHSLFSRLLVMRLDYDIACNFPLGMGFGQRGFYWMPLENHLQSLTNEEKIWVLYAQNDKARGIPQLSEYGSALGETGFPGLLLLFAVLIFIGIRAFRYFVKTHDAYVGFMLCAYFAMTVGLATIPLTNTNMYFLFSGFLYAISGDEQRSPAHATPERSLGSTSS